MAITKPDLTRIWAVDAVSGDVVDPDSIVPGKFADGWGAEIPPFEYFNFIQNLITSGLGYLNEQGIPGWDTDTVYPIDAIVKGSDSIIYQATVEQSGNDPVSDGFTNWKLIPSSSTGYDGTASGLVAENVKDAIDEIVIEDITVEGIKTFALSPLVPTPAFGDDSTKTATTEFVNDVIAGEVITGTTTFTNSTNNINLTGIGAIIGLEVGDVIQVTDSISNNTEFTIEVITDTDNVIVNQAHAGFTSSKSLVDETSTAGVTVRLLSKWYNAPIGLGQGWINLGKDTNIIYSNNTGRSIVVFAQANSNSDLRLIVGTVRVAGFISGTGLQMYVTGIVPNGENYEVESATRNAWSELR